MAFFGILIVSWIMMIIIFFVVAVFLFVFVPCLIISIINLVNGIRNHWPKRNIIPLAITGSVVVLLFVIFITFVVVLILTYQMQIDNGEEATSSVYIVNQILDFIK